MPGSIGDLIALLLGIVVLWVPGGIFSHDVAPGDRRGSPRTVKGGS